MEHQQETIEVETRSRDHHALLKRDFQHLVENHMGPLYQVALRLTRNSADAEDLVAEAVTRAWTSFGSLKQQQRFRPWVFRILHNCFVSQYRKKAVRPTEVSYDDAGEDGEDRYELCSMLTEQPHEFLVWWADPEKETEALLLRDRLLEALDELPEAYSATIMLVTVEGFSYDEAAVVLNVPPGTVRSRMKRGRTMLQKNLWQLGKEAGLVSAKNPSE